MDEFYRIKRLPPYVFAIVNDLKTKARARGEDIIDLGMGNPDMATPKHIVDKLVEAAKNPKNHRYSASRGITRLRVAMAKWYRDRYAVELDPNSEVIATIGAKEGMAHLALAVLQPGDGALVPNPTYPDPRLFGRDRRRRSAVGAADAGRRLLRASSGNGAAGVAEGQAADPVVPAQPDHDVRGPRLLRARSSTSRASTGSWSCTTSPTPTSRSTATAPVLPRGAGRQGRRASRSSRPRSRTTWRAGGWGSCAATRNMVSALARIKSYLDYGAFQPIQIAGIVALECDQKCVEEIVEVHRKRRDVLVNGLNKIGWNVRKPKGTMFVWAPIPEAVPGPRLAGVLQAAHRGGQGGGLARHRLRRVRRRLRPLRAGGERAPDPPGPARTQASAAAEPEPGVTA